MKTKLKYFSLAIAALLMVGFASCSSDDEPTMGGDENETKTVVLKFSEGPTTRKVGKPEGGTDNTVAVTFTNGDVYFVGESGANRAHYTISDKATEGKNINNSALKNGGTLTIADVPGGVNKVVIVGNYPINNNTATTPEAITPPGALPTLPTPIRSIKDHKLLVENQSNFEYVNLYGEGDLAVTSAADGDTKAVWGGTVVLNPTVARIELSELLAEGAITGYTLEGIFIDQYYTTATIEGVVSGFVQSPKNVGEAYFTDKATDSYPTKYRNSIYDWYDTGLAVEDLAGSDRSHSVSLKPENAAASNPTAEAGSVWGYNLFAQTGVSKLPRIVLRFKGITTAAAGVDLSGTRFVTIGGFNDTNEGTPAAITDLKPGFVYRIKPVKFQGVNLTTAPNIRPIDVNVAVELANWKVTDLYPVVQ